MAEALSHCLGFYFRTGSRAALQYLVDEGLQRACFFSLQELGFEVATGLAGRLDGTVEASDVGVECLVGDFSWIGAQDLQKVS